MIEKTADYGDIPYGDRRRHRSPPTSCAENVGFPFAYWSDNSFFGWHPSEKDKYKNEDAWGKWIVTMPGYNWDPAKMGQTIDRNVYIHRPARWRSFYTDVRMRRKSEDVHRSARTDQGQRLRSVQRDCRSEV